MNISNRMRPFAFCAMACAGVGASVAATVEYDFPNKSDELTSAAAWEGTHLPTATNRVVFKATGHAYTVSEDFLLGGIKVEKQAGVNTFTAANGITVGVPTGFIQSKNNTDTTLAGGKWDFGTGGVLRPGNGYAIGNYNTVRIENAVLTNVNSVQVGYYSTDNRIVLDNGSRLYTKGFSPFSDASVNGSFEICGGSQVVSADTDANRGFGTTGAKNNTFLVSGEGSLYTNRTNSPIIFGGANSSRLICRAEEKGKMYLQSGVYFANAGTSHSNRLEAAGGDIIFSSLNFPAAQGSHDNWIDASDNGTFQVTGTSTIQSSNNTVRAACGGTVLFAGQVTQKGKDCVCVMSNGTIKASGYYVFDNGASCTNNIFVFQGKSPKLDVKYFYPRKGTRFRFEVPKEGYDEGARVVTHNLPESNRVYFDFVGLEKFPRSFKGVKTMTLWEDATSSVGNLQASVDLTNQELAAAGHSGVWLTIVDRKRIVLNIKGRLGLVIIVS